MARTSLQTDRRVLTLPTLRLQRRRARGRRARAQQHLILEGEPSRAEMRRLVLGCVSRSASEAGCGGGRPDNQPSLLTVPKQQRTAEESHLRHFRRPFVRWKRPSRLDPNGCGGGTNEPNFRGLLPPGGVASLAVARLRADPGRGGHCEISPQWTAHDGVVLAGRLALLQAAGTAAPSSLETLRFLRRAWPDAFPARVGDNQRRAHPRATHGGRRRIHTRGSSPLVHLAAGGGP
jgi:hypothetical protein